MNQCGVKRKRAKMLVAAAWGLSCLFSVPAIFLNEEVMVKGHPQCWINLQPWQWQLYITLVALSLFFVPAVVIASCYSIIVHTIWNKSRTTAFTKSANRYHSKKQSQNARGAQTFENSVNSCVEEESVCERSSSRGVIPRAKIKTVKMTPYFVWDLLQVYGFIPNTQTTIALSTFIQSLAPLNSAANPLIYCLFSTRISRNIRQVMQTFIINK
ncbi:cardioacceleratory peptide receptor-like protein [Leptotrombidium deliense]|uniref:Cardioacceleratory peptide receptor-like protein n=1 Tax=Leptotrombidium deliense TaxID=299467 RepID=A0A443SVT4_9ACAR|nr:cardioacceleratory peptide receptor-like protein [Leptotrombidium deliense]